MREIGGWFGLEDDGDAGGDADLVTVVCLGCPFEEPGAFRGGASGGPTAIRRWTRSCEAVAEDGRPVTGLRVVDVGDVESSGEGERVASIRAAAAAALENHPGALLLGLGGDHGVTPPLVEAVAEAREPPAVVVLDAHPDGFRRYGGREDSHACVLPRLWEIAGVGPETTAVVGVRSYAPRELEVLEEAAAVVSAAEWHERGSTAVAERVASVLEGHRIYLSLDVDVLDPASAPGTGYPVPGGPDTRSLLRLLERLTARLPPIGLDVVEVAPGLDPTEVTAATAAHLCLQIFAFLTADR